MRRREATSPTVFGPSFGERRPNFRVYGRSTNGLNRLLVDPDLHDHGALVLACKDLDRRVGR